MTRGKKISLFNPNPTPVVFDGEGRIVGGGERVEVDTVGKVAQEAVDHGLLVQEDPEESQPRKGAVKAPGPGESAPEKAS